MMNIITNEREYAEKILNEGEKSDKISDKDVCRTLSIIGRYYKAEGLTEKHIKEKLNEFIDERCSEKIQSNRKQALTKAMKPIKQFSLTEISEIIITKPEMERIKAIVPPRSGVHAKSLQKLAATFLVLAKFHMAKGGREPWVRQDYTTLFKIANVLVNHRDDRVLYVTDLIDLGLIMDTERIGKNELKVLFIEDGEPELSIPDINQVGKYFEQHTTDKKFVRCEVCGKLMKPSSRNQKYCKNCKADANRKRTAERMRNLRAKYKATAQES